MKWKSLPSKYWILHRIGLGRCQAEEVKEAKEFLSQQIPEIAAGEEVGEREIIGQLWQLYQSEGSDQLAEVCLRCVISHYIKEYCYKLAEQYGRKHNFTVDDLLPLVLDSTDRSLNHGNNNSLTIRILQTFSLGKKSSLSTWTKIIVRSDRELKRFLLQYGLEQVTDWLLLKQYNSRQLQRILSDYHYSPAKLKQLTKLLESYQTVYLGRIQAARDQINQERQQQGLGKVKSPYPMPDRQQLQQIAEQLLPTWRLSPEEVLEELQNLAQFIREYKSSRAKGIVATQYLGKTKTIVPTSTEDEEDEEKRFLASFNQQYDSCFLRAVREVIENRIQFYQNKKKPQEQQFLSALHFYHCQVVPMGEIAPKIGLKKQYQVSRLLEQKEIRADVARKTVNYLILAIFQLLPEEPSPEKQSELRKKLTPILYEKVNAEMQKAQKEDSVSKNRSMKNKLSQAICQYLDRIYKQS
ncbi:hypothetical protein NUACC21_55230 [Scytonema sp. NUACC21]